MAFKTKIIIVAFAFGVVVAFFSGYWACGHNSSERIKRYGGRIDDLQTELDSTGRTISELTDGLRWAATGNNELTQQIERIAESNRQLSGSIGDIRSTIRTDSDRLQFVIDRFDYYSEQVEGEK
ncbi:MAG: hypothetical protein PQJ60_10890 [Spirochaetales bacterium]|nr:hypothetical protein [Spirochaetales bacterium]